MGISPLLKALFSRGKLRLAHFLLQCAAKDPTRCVDPAEVGTLISKVTVLCVKVIR
jgi:hypothetical protein